MILNSEDLFSSSASSAKRKRRWAQSIGKRLALGFFALVVLMMIVLLQAVLQNYKANQTMQEFASQDVTRLNGVHLLGLQIEGLGSALSRLIHAERNFRVKEYEDVDGRNRHILQTLEMLSNSLTDPAQIAVLQRLAVANNAYKVAFQEVADQVEAGDTAAAGRALNTHVNPALRSMLSELNTLLQHEKDSMDRRLARAQASFHQALILIATLSAALMAMAIWLAWLTTRSVVQPLSALEAAADIMADGNYATVVPRTGADEVDRVGTALNRMAANVTRTNVLLQSVFDAASEVAIVATGLAGTITIFNRGAERLFGYAATEVVGVHTNDLLFDPEELERNGVAMSQATGRTVAGVDVLTDQSVLGKTTEWTVIRKDGSHIFVALVVTNLFDTEGVLAGYLAISYDISQEKAARESLNEALADAEAATAAA